MIRLLRWVSLRRFVGGKLRTFLTIVGIAAGVAALVATGAANESILKGFRSTLDAVGGDADISITGSLAGSLAEDLPDKVRDVPGVKSVEPAITEVAKLPDETRLYVFGVDMAAGDQTRGVNAFESDGDAPDAMEFLNDPDGVLISKKFAAEQGLKVGDRFPIASTTGRRDLHVRGLLNERGPAKAFGGRVAVMDLYNAQGTFGRGKHIDRVDLSVAQGADIDQVIAAVKARIGPGPTVGRPERKGKSTEMMLRTFQVGLYMGAAVSIVVGLFLLFNTMSFAVTQRRREIGTLRAIGVSRISIAGMIAVEAMIYGAIGSGLGIVIGKMLAQVTVARALKGINYAYMSVNVSDATPPPSILIAAMALGIFGSVVAALIPAIEAATVPPVDALRRDRMPRKEKPPTFAGRFLGIGVACLAWPLLQLPLIGGAPVFGNLAMGVINLGGAIAAPSAIDLVHWMLARPVSTVFGAPGRVALAGLIRARRRSGVAAGAVLIGISLVLCTDTFVTSFRGAVNGWVERSIPADLFVVQGAATIGIANTPMPPTVGDIITHVPGVESVQKVRLVWMDLFDMRVGIFGFDWNEYARHAHPMFTQGSMADTLKPSADVTAIISDNLARRVGLKVGDKVNLPTPDGMVPVTIVGAIIDYSSDRGTLMLNRDVFIRLFHDDLVDSYDTYLQPGQNLDDARGRVEKALAFNPDFRVLSNAALRASIFSLLDDFFALVYVLLSISVAVGVLGVVGTLLAQVLDRTRELGIIRAMGASRWQVLGSVAIEAALLAFAGVMIGVPAGMLMGSVMVHVVGVQATGWNFPPLYPYAFAATTSLASIGFAALGGLFPAYRAASLDVAEAIGYE